MTYTILNLCDFIFSELCTLSYVIKNTWILIVNSYNCKKDYNHLTFFIIVIILGNAFPVK